MIPITIHGSTFQKQGKPWTYVGVSAFALFKRWLMDNGPAALVAPILDEWRAVAKAGGYDGDLVLRVFRFAAPPNAFALDPWSYPMSAVTAFTEFCGDRGFYVDWTCGDAQIVLPEKDGPRGQQEHLNQFCAALVPTFAFVETVNEWFKNGIDPGQVKPEKWGSYLRDSGYYTEIDNWDRSMNLDFVSYHSGRGGPGDWTPWPKWLFDLNDQAATLLHAFQVPMVLKEPIGAADMDKPGSRCANPDYFFRMGLSAAYAGITFHSDCGEPCDGLTPPQRGCAEAFFAGVAGALR